MKKAFTLIELLVTISIIALIMAISIFGLANARQSARDGRRKSDIESIRSALELYRSDCGQYPPTSGNGRLQFGSALTGSQSSGNTCLTSYRYMETVPADPGSASYTYSRPTTTTYELCATLEQPGNGSTCGTGGSCTCGGSTSCGSGTCRYKAVSP